MHNIPKMGIGTTSETGTGRSTIEKIVFESLKQGFRHFELAPYGNSLAIRRALQKAYLPLTAGGLGLCREDIFLTIKALPPYSADVLRETLDALGEDYFDLLVIHTPVRDGIFDSRETLTETWRSLCLLTPTLLRHIGVSNFYEPHLKRLIDVCIKEGLQQPYVNEIEMNPMAQQQGVVALCKENGIKVLAYSPLGSMNHIVVLDDEPIQEVSRLIDATPAQTALAYLMSQDIDVLTYSSSSEHLQENKMAETFIEAIAPYASRITRTTPTPSYLVSDFAENAQKHGESLTWDLSEPFGYSR